MSKSTSKSTGGEGGSSRAEAQRAQRKREEANSRTDEQPNYEGGRGEGTAEQRNSRTTKGEVALCRDTRRTDEQWPVSTQRLAPIS